MGEQDWRKSGRAAPFLEGLISMESAEVVVANLNGDDAGFCLMIYDEALGIEQEYSFTGEQVERLIENLRGALASGA